MNTKAPNKQKRSTKNLEDVLLTTKLEDMGFEIPLVDVEIQVCMLYLSCLYAVERLWQPSKSLLGRWDCPKWISSAARMHTSLPELMTVPRLCK